MAPLEDFDGEAVLVGPLGLPGVLEVPAQALGLVLFAHGSGSSRRSPRNRFVAAQLQREGLATLLFDLLGSDEETERRNVFDIELLAERLLQAMQWAQSHALLSALPLGLFGASTGAAAALLAAARRPALVRAVVSRGGRPDLAGDALADVRAPTMLIVGGLDEAVLALNRQAMARLRQAEHRLEIVPGATHLFEEAGALPAVARLAGSWFRRHFEAAPGRPG